MQRLPRLSALLAVVLLTACSEPVASPPPEQPVTWHRDVAPLVQEKCGGCHVEGGIAPFTLQSYTEAFTMREALKAAVKARMMPPWQADPQCTEYADDRSLTDEQIALFTRWVDEGGMEGDAAEAPAQAPRTSQGGLPRVDLELAMPVEYSPTQSPDEYRCFVLDWPETDLRYITGFVARPGQPSLVHHILAFLISPEQVDTYKALDAAEPGAGYPCFGGPGGNNGRPALIGGWAPGGRAALFPQGAGIRVRPGSKVVLQLHYNLSSANALPDRTSIALTLASSVEKIAIMQQWANPRWVDPGGMPIPAGQRDVRHYFAFDLASALSFITGGEFQNNQPFTVHGAGLHMHTHGTWARLDIERRSGAKECMVHIPRWDFHWQGGYGFAQPKVVKPGDRIALECHWDNSLPNAKDLEWGEGTGDEMCLGTFLMTQ
jgi:hypothetical protein